MFVRLALMARKVWGHAKQTRLSTKHEDMLQLFVLEKDCASNMGEVNPCTDILLAKLAHVKRSVGETYPPSTL